MKDEVKKHSNISQISNEFKNVFPEPPIMHFRKSKNLKDFLWTKTIVDNKSQKVILTNRKGIQYHLPQKLENYVANK